MPPWGSGGMGDDDVRVDLGEDSIHASTGVWDIGSAL